MHSLRNNLKWFSLILITPAFLYGQSSDLRVEKEFFVNPRVILLSDFNFTGSGSSRPLFRVTLRNLGPQTKMVVLGFQVRSRKRPDRPIVEAQSLPFPLSPNNPIRITNIDLVRNRLKNIKLRYFRYNEEVAQNLRRAILRRGRLPNDVYEIIVRLEEANNSNNRDQIVEALVINNPTRVDLLSPGRIADRGRCSVVYTRQPQFQWLSNADRFIFTVSEALPTNTSPEDVMQNRPHARIILKRGKDFQGAPSIVYPSTGVRPLVEGRTYYWQVIAQIETPNGFIDIPSEIWCFQLARLNDVNRQIVDRSVRSSLRRLLAGSRFSQLLGPRGPLKDFQATGVIFLNGRKIEITNLNAFLSNFLTQKPEIVSVSIE